MCEYPCGLVHSLRGCPRGGESQERRYATPMRAGRDEQSLIGMCDACVRDDGLTDLTALGSSDQGVRDQGVRDQGVTGGIFDTLCIRRA